MLVFAQHRSTNGAFQQILFRSSADTFLGPVPEIDRQLDSQATAPFLPDIQVADRNLELPRTWSFSVGLDRDLGRGMAASANFVYARTDQLFRFVNRNDPAFGSPFGIGTHPSGGGINALTVAESSARSRYQALTVGLRGWSSVGDRPLTFETHYTLAFDRSDDDNERDPFTFRYADPSNLGPEFGWSDRDRRHQVSGYLLVTLPGRSELEQRVPLPVGLSRLGAVRPSGRTREPALGPHLRRRVHPDPEHAPGATTSSSPWDLRISRSFALPSGATVEPIVEVFNLTGADNFLDSHTGSLLFNFDGTLRSGLGDTRRGQLGISLRF